MNTPTEHETVGRLFHVGAAIYRCTRWERRCGFWMRLVEGVDWWAPGRRPGDEACVSERAIGRTFHLVESTGVPTPHEQPCDCHVCKPEER